MKDNILIMDNLEKIISFVCRIGIPFSLETVDSKTFLPGILIRNGGLVVDRNKLLYPGDILHEAGHLAVMPERIRKNMNGDLGGDVIHQGGELAAIAWSYAACVHLQMEPEVVFHEHGYKGASSSIIENFKNGHYFGVPLLAWQEMCLEKDATNREPVFPHMKSWLCRIDRYLTEVI